MNSQTIHVLVIEDNPSDAALAIDALGGTRQKRIEVSRVSRLAAGIDHARGKLTDVVLLDLGLPDGQGLETFIGAYEALPNIPIIVLSGMSDEELAIECVQRGAQDYLLKCAAMREVLPRAIKYAIERHHTQQQIKRFAQDLKKKNDALEEELKMARSVQQRLLSRNYPQLFDASGLHSRALQFAHRYAPAETLSGDFFHIIRLSNNQAGVLICDVMGHGVSAALLGALTRGFVDQFMPIAFEPGTFLKYLNRELTKTLKQADIEAFATAFYCVADVAERKVHYANAGHPSPMIVRRDADSVEWLQVERPCHPPLGLVLDTEYPTFSTGFCENDSILLFTDGLFEQENPEGEQFGYQRVLDTVTRLKHLPCKALLDELLKETKEYSGQEEFDDDVCMVGMDVVERSVNRFFGHLGSRKNGTER